MTLQPDDPRVGQRLRRLLQKSLDRLHPHDRAACYANPGLSSVLRRDGTVDYYGDSGRILVASIEPGVLTADEEPDEPTMLPTAPDDPSELLE